MMPYEYRYTPQNWEIDLNGFMRNSIRFMKTGCMEYLGEELGPEREPEILEDDVLDIMVHPDTLFDPTSIRSLEGMPVVAYEHEWADVENMTFDQTDSLGQKFAQVGSVAGTPRQNGPYLEGDIVITNKFIQDAIKTGELVDVSSGYNALYEMISGEYDGTKYHGSQRGIRYNHVCLLPPNEGRAGTDVRILNTKSNSEAKVDTVKIQLPGTDTMVTVLASDANAVTNAFTNIQNKKPEKIQVQNMEMSAADIEAKMAENVTLKEQIAELQGQLDTNNGELATLKEQLDAAISPEAIQEAASNMVEEQDESMEMLTQNAGDHETMNSKEKIEEVRNSLKGLTGHSLRKHVVTQIRAMNKLPELSAENQENEGYITGVYNSYKEMAKIKSSKAPESKQVVGLHNVQNNAANQGGGRSGTEKLGFAKPKAEAS